MWAIQVALCWQKAMLAARASLPPVASPDVVEAGLQGEPEAPVAMAVTATPSSQGGLAGVANRSFYNGAYRNATGTGSGGVGGMAFRASMTKGGDIANNVISRIATGGAGSGDVMSGNMAADALMSYMGYTALGEGAADIPNFSNVEIGGGHITGTETSEEEPAGRAFAMYSTEQYMEPKREYTTVTTVDGAKWYRQYAQDVVEKKPYQNGWRHFLS